jgi:hypothetical protein
MGQPMVRLTWPDDTQDGTGNKWRAEVCVTSVTRSHVGVRGEAERDRGTQVGVREYAEGGVGR